MIPMLEESLEQRAVSTKSADLSHVKRARSIASLLRYFRPSTINSFHLSYVACLSLEVHFYPTRSPLYLLFASLTLLLQATGKRKKPQNCQNHISNQFVDMTNPTSSKKGQAKKAAKAKLSGFAIPKDDTPKNNKIVFGDSDDNEDDYVSENEGIEGIDAEDDVDEGAVSDNDDDNSNCEENDDDDVDYDDDAVEEVKGSSARESTQKLRDAERKIAKETATARLKKKRKKRTDDGKKADVKVQEESDGDNESVDSDADDDEDDDELLTDDFFKMVDSERADHLTKIKRDKKKKKLEQKKQLGKHTTFVVEDDYKMIHVPKKMNQNIEVVAIGGGEKNEDGDDDVDINIDSERQLLISATLGSAPSKAAVLFARGSLSSGMSKERSCESRKRKSKNEETWKRSRKMNSFGAGARPGQAATLFVRRT